MICSQDVEIEKIKLRIEILQQELDLFFSQLKKAYRKERFRDSCFTLSVCQRVENMKDEFLDLKNRLQLFRKEQEKS